MSRKICVVTGSRAEYGLLRGVMEAIRRTPELELQVVATGMHLSPEFGNTVQVIDDESLVRLQPPTARSFNRMRSTSNLELHAAHV